MARSRIRLSNRSVFTSLRKILREAEREADELVHIPFLTEEEQNIAQNIYQQIMFCLEISRDI